MRLPPEEVEDWKFVGFFLFGGWCESSPTDEAYVAPIIQRHPRLLVDLYRLRVRGPEEEEGLFCQSLLSGGKAPSALRTEDQWETESQQLFFGLLTSLTDPKIRKVAGVQTQPFLERLIGDPSAGELMFVVIANNLRFEQGRINNAAFAIGRGVQATAEFLRVDGPKPDPPIQPWEAIG